MGFRTTQSARPSPDGGFRARKKPRERSLAQMRTTGRDRTGRDKAERDKDQERSHARLSQATHAPIQHQRFDTGDTG